MTDREPKHAYVYQPEPAEETYCFAVAGPGAEYLEHARFASWEMADAVATHVRMLSSPRTSERREG